MPINENIPLSFIRPKIAGPADVLSLKDLSTRVQANEFQFQQAKEMAPLDRRIKEAGLMKDQHDMQDGLIKRREALSRDVNEAAYNAYQVAKSRGSPESIAEHEMRRAYLEKLEEQEASGQLAISGISREQAAAARAKAPTFKDIEAKILTPQQAAEKADYASVSPQGAPQGVPLSQIANMSPMQGPVMPPAGVEGDLLGNGPVRQPAQNAPMTLPETQVTATPPPDSPDGLRKEAQRLERMGTKLGFERAKEVRAEADRLDKLSMDAEGREMAQKRYGLDRERFEFDKIKEQNDLQNKGKTVAQKDQELTTKLSDDYEKNPAVKDYNTVQPLVASMENAFKKDSGAADLDMVYALAKIYDPGSVVREGEQVLVVKSGGLPSQVQDWIGWVNGGQRLSSKVRKGMVEQAKSRADNYKQGADAVASSYRRQAKEWGLNADNIVRTYQIQAREGVTPSPRKDEQKRRASDKTINFEDLK